MGATEVTKAVSEVNIPEVADKSTDTLVDAEAGGTARGTSKKFTVAYKICAIISITLLVLGIILLPVSVVRIDEPPFIGEFPPHHGYTVLGFFSAFLIAFAFAFAFIPIIYCLCQCFGIALS